MRNITTHYAWDTLMLRLVKERLANLILENMELAIHSFKSGLCRRWTWKSPNGTTKNVIDCIITDKDNIKDITVINTVDIRATIEWLRGELNF